jgi:hypothetical protein
MPENRVLKIIFGPGRVEVTGGWRKQYTNKLHNFYCYWNEKILKGERGGACSMHEKLQMHTHLWFKNLKVRKLLDATGTNGRIKQKHISKK